jgi:putative membrane protein
MASFFRISLLFSLALLLIYLTISRELNNYINPQFQYFTIFSFVVLLLFCWIQQKYYRQHSLHPIGIWGYFAIGLPIVCYLLFPGKPSDARLADQKTFVGVQNEINSDEQKSKSLIQAPIIVLTNKNYIEITNLLMTYPDKFKGKKVRTEGFVYREENFPPHTFVLARLALTCCVADAGIVGFFIESPTATTLKNDQWLQIEGTFELKQTEFGEVPSLQRINYKKIAQPKDSYLYQPF